MGTVFNPTVFANDIINLLILLTQKFRRGLPIRLESWFKFVFFAYNTSFHSSICCSLKFLTFGREARLLIDIVIAYLRTISYQRPLVHRTFSKMSGQICCVYFLFYFFCFLCFSLFAKVWVQCIRARKTVPTSGPSSEHFLRGIALESDSRRPHRALQNFSRVVLSLTM